eukprot:Tbor_TRINITY_DN5594_c2_g6::TRINITY_DN5594_c2_g6_i1::g.13714::m.13714
MSSSLSHAPPLPVSCGFTFNLRREMNVLVSVRQLTLRRAYHLQLIFVICCICGFSSLLSSISISYGNGPTTQSHHQPQLAALPFLFTSAKALHVQSDGTECPARLCSSCPHIDLDDTDGTAYPQRALCGSLLSIIAKGSSNTAITSPQINPLSLQAPINMTNISIDSYIPPFSTLGFDYEQFRKSEFCTRDVVVKTAYGIDHTTLGMTLSVIGMACWGSNASKGNTSITQSDILVRALVERKRTIGGVSMNGCGGEWSYNGYITDEAGTDEEGIEGCYAVGEFSAHHNVPNIPFVPQVQKRSTRQNAEKNSSLNTEVGDSNNIPFPGEGSVPTLHSTVWKGLGLLYWGLGVNISDHHDYFASIPTLNKSSAHLLNKSEKYTSNIGSKSVGRHSYDLLKNLFPVLRSMTVLGFVLESPNRTRNEANYNVGGNHRNLFSEEEDDITLLGQLTQEMEIDQYSDITQPIDRKPKNWPQNFTPNTPIRDTLNPVTSIQQAKGNLSTSETGNLYKQIRRNKLRHMTIDGFRNTVRTSSQILLYKWVDNLLTVVYDDRVASLTSGHRPVIDPPISQEEILDLENFHQERQAAVARLICHEFDHSNVLKGVSNGNKRKIINSTDDYHMKYEPRYMEHGDLPRTFTISTSITDSGYIIYLSKKDRIYDALTQLSALSALGIGEFADICSGTMHHTSVSQTNGETEIDRSDNISSLEVITPRNVFCRRASHLMLATISRTVKVEEYSGRVLGLSRSVPLSGEIETDAVDVETTAMGILALRRINETLPSFRKSCAESVEPPNYYYSLKRGSKEERIQICFLGEPLKVCMNRWQLMLRSSFFIAVARSCIIKRNDWRYGNYSFYPSGAPNSFQDIMGLLPRGTANNLQSNIPLSSEVGECNNNPVVSLRATALWALASSQSGNIFSMSMCRVSPFAPKVFPEPIIPHWTPNPTPSILRQYSRVILAVGVFTGTILVLGCVALFVITVNRKRNTILQNDNDPALDVYYDRSRESITKGGGDNTMNFNIFKGAVYNDYDDLHGLLLGRSSDGLGVPIGKMNPYYQPRNPKETYTNKSYNIDGGAGERDIYILLEPGADGVNTKLDAKGIRPYSSDRLREARPANCIPAGPTVSEQVSPIVHRLNITNTNDVILPHYKSGEESLFRTSKEGSPQKYTVSKQLPASMKKEEDSVLDLSEHNNVEN